MYIGYHLVRYIIGSSLRSVYSDTHFKREFSKYRRVANAFVNNNYIGVCETEPLYIVYPIIINWFVYSHQGRTIGYVWESEFLFIESLS